MSLSILIIAAGLLALMACVAVYFWGVQQRSHLQFACEQLQKDLNEITAEHALWESKAHQLETENALLKQQLSMQEAKQKDWEEMRQQSLQAAKASVLEAGSQLSNKLLEDHKREAAAMQKESEKKTRQASQQLMQQFERITEKVGHLQGSMSGQQQQVDTLWKAMSQPAQAGSFAEIGLENSLQSFGLEPGRDYIAQAHIANEDGSRYRPDILIFLPNQTALVIDSKASTFLLDLAAKEGTEDEAQALQGLKQSMREHLRILSGKQYHQSVQQAYKESGMEDKARRVLNVMYVPHEATLERLNRVDPEFRDMCRGKDVIVTGPSGLSGLLALARMDMTQARQLESHEAIIAATEDLLESVALTVNYVSKAGRGLKMASDNFSQLCKSLNTRMLPRARKLEKLGVSPAKGKQLPPQISHFHMIEDSPLIEAESQSSSPLELMLEEKKA